MRRALFLGKIGSCHGHTGPLFQSVGDPFNIGSFVHFKFTEMVAFIAALLEDHSIVAVVVVTLHQDGYFAARPTFGEARGVIAAKPPSNIRRVVFDSLVFVVVLVESRDWNLASQCGYHFCMERWVRAVAVSATSEIHFLFVIPQIGHFGSDDNDRSIERQMAKRMITT